MEIILISFFLGQLCGAALLGLVLFKFSSKIPTVVWTKNPMHDGMEDVDIDRVALAKDRNRKRERLQAN